MYKSIMTWRDLTDRHLYHEGDIFPHDGREIPEERIASLLSGLNGAGRAVISEVETDKGKTIAEAEEKPKRAVKSRKNVS